MYLINRVNKTYFRRLRGLFSRFKRYRFTGNILIAFNIFIRSRSSFFLSKIMSKEFVFANRTKRDLRTLDFIRLVKQMVAFVRQHQTLLHGLRIHLKGRFRGSMRANKKRYFQGTVPFNTMRANVDYIASKSITLNGSFGIHIWGCYNLKSI